MDVSVIRNSVPKGKLKVRDPKVAKALRNDSNSKSPSAINAKQLARKNTQIVWQAFQYYIQLTRVHSYVSEHPRENLTLDKAASIAAMARNYFAVFFHRHTGVTFKCYIDFGRVNRAAKLLQGSNLSINEVAFECGFIDATTFTRTFRRVRGVSPREFRRCIKPSES